VYPETAFQQGFQIEAANGAGVDSEDLKAWSALDKALYPEGAFVRAEEYSRIHGGSLLVMGADGDMSQPIQDGATIHWLEPISCAQLEITQERDCGKDPTDALTYRRPIRFVIKASHRMGGMIIHHTRCIVFTGAPRAPRELIAWGGRRTRYSIWGLSVLTPAYQSLSDYGVAWASISELMQLSSIGVLKMAGLIQSIATEDTSAVQARADLMSQLMSVNKLLMLDPEHNEDYSREPVSFADIPQLLQITLHMSAVSDVPVFLLGQASSGLNSSSAVDLQQWYDRVVAYFDRQLRANLERAVGLVVGRDVKVKLPTLGETAESRGVILQRNLQNAEAGWRMGAWSELEVRQNFASKDGSSGFRVEDPDRLPIDLTDPSPGVRIIQIAGENKLTPEQLADPEANAEAGLTVTKGKTGGLSDPNADPKARPANHDPARGPDGKRQK
jgi:phage-related protein (TIGR01555 family)